VKGEGKVHLSYQVIDGQYPDGAAYQLYQPRYQLKELAYGPLSSTSRLSPRFAPVVYGAGLLDAISIDDLLAQEDPDDQNQDGVSARYNRVPLLASSHPSETFHRQADGAIGRFGMKAKHPSLHQQVAAAFRDDIGISNPLFSGPPCSSMQQACKQADQLGGHDGPEINAEMLSLVTEFNQYLAVPPARQLNQDAQQQGRELFYQVGCASCHTPSYITASDYPTQALANQRIWPYTDLALHDMGPDLADGVQEYSASGQEWKTPALWGIGLRKKLNSDSRFLHDGRARTVEQAILWHGGEATASQQAFTHLSVSERSAVLRFLDAI
jgi:CxxC motif-containing protein (DUF1111 family)